MTNALIDDSALSPEDAADLARLHELARKLGRQPGRPLIIQHLDVTDSRARKLIALAREHQPAHADGPGRTTGVRHLAPAGERPLQVVTPAGATPSHQAQPPADAHHPQTDMPGAGPATQTLAPGGDQSPTWRHATTQPPTTNATTRTHQQPPAGALGLYTVAVMSLGVSFDTSWRVFGEKFGINGWERLLMFAVLEAALVACAYSMRAGVRANGHPGPIRFWTWALCGVSAYMALVLSGPFVGPLRVALGPALGLVMLHSALGIEVRARKGAKATTWTRIGRELRERLLSRLGLADDERDARARTRDRAALRAARLSLAKHALFRSTRVARNVARAGVAHDPATRDRMLAELAAIRHAGDLAALCQASPWLAPPRRAD